MEGIIRKLNGPIVVSGDFNAKNQGWGGETINTRGENLMNWILLNNFNLENKRGPPTFDCSRGHSWIDVTFSKNIEVINWMVINEESLSDHRIITFEIIKNVIKKEHKWIYDFTNTNWQIFTEKLKLYKSKNNLQTITDLEEEAKNFQNACSEVCKKFIKKIRQPDFFNFTKQQ